MITTLTPACDTAVVAENDREDSGERWVWVCSDVLAGSTGSGMRVYRQWDEGHRQWDEGLQAVDEGLQAVDEGLQAVDEGLQAVDEGIQAVG